MSFVVVVVRDDVTHVCRSWTLVVTVKPQLCEHFRCGLGATGG